MITAKSYIFNPILSPNPKNNWENEAVFNGSVIQDGHKYIMVYRALGQGQSTIGFATSTDGFNFNHRRQILFPQHPWEKFGLEDPRLTKIDNQYYIFYTAISDQTPGPDSIKIAVAVTSDFVNFEKHLVTPFNAKAMALFPKKINGKYVAILTANTDLPPSRTALAFFEKETDLWSEEYWHTWYQNLISNEINFRRITTDHTEIGAVPIETTSGWLLIYSHIENYFNGSYGTFGIEAVLLDKTNPRSIIGRTVTPLLVPQENYELEGMVANVVFPSGVLIKDDQLLIYYGSADNYVCLSSVSLDELIATLIHHRHSVPKLIRFSGNPIITPRSGVDWESRATFNPAAILIDSTIYIVYRAMSLDNTSVLGLAQSQDGITITNRESNPICLPEHHFETKKNTNSFSGCEDPRLTQIGDKIYMCYTAYDGTNPPSIALTSILVKDFVSKHWNFQTPIIISDPRVDNKDGCLFPEKINGLYTFLHREGGKGIMIDHVTDLEFKNNRHLEGDVCFSLGHNDWENAKMGIASPPIKTEKGWLLLYHGVSRQDQHYRVGAMLLKLDDPKIVLGRTKYPLLEPEMAYEKIGEVNNVVFPCGAVVKNGEIFVYYGGGDKVVGVAVGHLSEIINSLI